MYLKVSRIFLILSMKNEPNLFAKDFSSSKDGRTVEFDRLNVLFSACHNLLLSPQFSLTRSRKKHPLFLFRMWLHLFICRRRRERFSEDLSLLQARSYCLRMHLAVTGLKALFYPSDCTGTAPTHKDLTFPLLEDRGSRMSIYERP